MEKESVLYLNTNNKKTLVLMGTSLGFKVLNFFTMNIIKEKAFSGGIGPIDCLETSNILAMTGGGLYPYFPTNKLIIWDDEKEKIKAEITLKSEINAVKFKYEYLFVVVDFKIYIYSIFENLNLKMEVMTLYNPKGLIETNAIDDPCLFAHLVYTDNNEENEEEGKISIYNLNDDTKVPLTAHTTLIKCMKFNYKGNFFATASTKGTLIRIFDTSNGSLLKELRRGIESTVIYSLDFDYFDNWLVCITKTGTLHVWCLK